MQIFEILPHGRQGPIHLPQSMPWLLMTWRYTEQPWYWLSTPETFQSHQKERVIHWGWHNMGSHAYFCTGTCIMSYGVILHRNISTSVDLGLDARPNHTCLIVCHCRIMLNSVSGIEKERKMRKSPISWKKNGGGCRRTVLQWLRNKS